MDKKWNVVKPAKCKNWLVLPTVYSDSLSYGEQLDKFCFQLNQLIENVNILPNFISEMIEDFISSGAIGEVVRDILADYILNVKYPPNGITPAVGDGSADDTAAIQGCIDYAVENGGVVYFPYGSYLTHPLTMKNGVSLFGFDRYSTKIVLKGGATKALLNGNGNNLSVCNLTLDGNSGIQVSDVNVVDMTGSNLMFNDLVIKDGYKLFNFVGDGHLQLSNIVFGNAIENCFTVDGNVIVQTNNLLFTALSKVGGVSVVDIKANGGNYDFNSVAKCDTCMMISGNDNKIVALIDGANEDYVDSGVRNNVEIVGHSQKEYYTGNIKQNANNSEFNLEGNREIAINGTDSLDIDGESTVNVGGLRTETYEEDKTEIIKGAYTENIRTRNTNISEKWIVNFPTRTIDMEKLTRVNVKEYGAIGDGVADDTTAIMNMISELGYAFFTPGTYLTNLDFAEPVSLIGCNPKTCILRAKEVNKNVVTFSSYCNAEGLTFTGGLNGIECKNAIGNIITACNAENNSQYGFFINGKDESWTDNSALTGLSYCYARLNGKGGIVIHDYADWKMDNCESVSNSDTFNQNSNVEIKNGAGKMVNCHFWNYNDGSGFKRPKVSLNLINCRETEITNCHIEGGYDSNISITGESAPAFVNCLIYNSFGAYSVWITSNHVKFIGCVLRTQAPDNVGYKPAWVAIFNNNGTDCMYGVLSKCEISGEIFANKNFKKWDIDSYLDFDSAKLLKNITLNTSIKGFQGDSRNIKMDDFSTSGGESIDIRYTTYGYITMDTTLIGVPYPGDKLYLYNATGETHNITLPTGYLWHGETVYQLKSHESIMIVFTTDSSIII